MECPIGLLSAAATVATGVAAGLLYLKGKCLILRSLQASN